MGVLLAALFEGVTQKFSFYENPFVAPPKQSALCSLRVSAYSQSALLLTREKGLLQKYINHARFRTGFLADACEDLFYQMVKRLENSGELSKETVFIDGTKLEACANKYTFVWKNP